MADKDKSKKENLTKEKDKSPVDYRKVDQPLADSIFWEPNDLGDALDNLSDYEDWSNTDNLFNNPDGGRLLVQKHEPYEDAEKAEKIKKVTKKAASEKIPNTETKKVDNALSNEKELDEILQDYDAYEKYLGLGPVGLTNDRVNTEEFPMDDEFNGSNNLKSKKKVI